MFLGLSSFSSCFLPQSQEGNNFEQDEHLGQEHSKSGSFPGFFTNAAPSALEDWCIGHTSSTFEGADFDLAALGSSAPDDASSEVTAPRCCCCSRSLGDAVDLDLRTAAAFLVSKVLVRECITSKFLVVFLRKRSDFFIACAAEWATEDLVTLLVDGSQRIGGFGGGASSPALDELFGLSDGSSLASCGVSTSASSPGDDAAMVNFR